MSDKCDDRAAARALTNTERELRLVEELLTRRWVLIEVEDGRPRRVGIAGLGWGYYNELRYRLEDRGFTFFQENPPGRGGRPYVRMVFPGESVI